AAVLLDKDLGISAHIYDQKQPRRYVQRQIERAAFVVANDFECPIDAKGNKGKPKSTPKNIRLAMAKLGVELKHDLFTGRVLVDGLEGHGPHFDDAVSRGIRMAI